MMLKVVATLGVLTASATPAAAQSPQNVVSVDGACQRLVIDGASLTSNCGPKVIQTIYANGRTGFYIATTDGSRVFAFSGFEQNITGQTKVVQTLDKIILSGKLAVSISVTGTCSYGNPYSGPMTILCEAEDDKNSRFQLEFLTDGSDPKIIQ